MDPIPPDLPLTALRAFVAAAREGSFVRAGAGLGVTPAAVSLQVRALEDHLGKRLFLRQGNRIALTDAGTALYPRLAAALAEIAAATGALRGGPSRARLVVSVLPTLAEWWVVPRLAGLARPLDLRVEEDPVRLGPGGADLRLTWGAHAYPEAGVEVLFRDALVPVAAPGCAGAFPDLACVPLIHTDWGPAYGTGPDWAAWARAVGLPPPGMDTGLRVDRSGLAVTAALAGLGVALVPERLAGAEIAAGRLARLPGPALPMARDYVAVTALAPARPKAVREVVAHLRGHSKK